jgi:hypothetical protein
VGSSQAGDRECVNFRTGHSSMHGRCRADAREAIRPDDVTIGEDLTPP